MLENAWVWIITAIVAAGVVALVGYLVYLIVCHYRFKTIFGFVPERNWRFRIVQQPRVDQKLAQLARGFDRSSKAESALLEKYYNRKEARNRPSEEDLLELKRLRRAVKAAKKAFWQAHEVAKVTKFEIDKKYSDYL